MGQVPRLQCHPEEVPQHITVPELRLCDPWQGACPGAAHGAFKHRGKNQLNTCLAPVCRATAPIKTGERHGMCKKWESFNRVYQGALLHSETQRNPLPQCFSQCLLKHFPKCFLISSLAWSPFLSICGVRWCFSHRDRRIREGKEEIKILVSIFSEFINFKDYPKSRTCNKIGNFSHILWLLAEVCFNGTPCPQVWWCLGSSDQTREVSSARALGIFLVLGRKSLSIA